MSNTSLHAWKGTTTTGPAHLATILKKKRGRFGGMLPCYRPRIAHSGRGPNRIPLCRAYCTSAILDLDIEATALSLGQSDVLIQKCNHCRPNKTVYT